MYLQPDDTGFDLLQNIFSLAFTPYHYLAFTPLNVLLDEVSTREYKLREVSSKMILIHHVAVEGALPNNTCYCSNLPQSGVNFLSLDLSTALPERAAKMAESPHVELERLYGREHVLQTTPRIIGDTP